MFQTELLQNLIPAKPIVQISFYWHQNMSHSHIQPHSAPDSHQFSRHSQMKNGNPRLLPTSQKIKTFLIFFLIRTFLDASTLLYKRACPSVGWLVCRSVRPSFRPSVRPSVGWSVHRSCGFIWIAEIDQKSSVNIIQPSRNWLNSTHSFIQYANSIMFNLLKLCLPRLDQVSTDCHIIANIQIWT